MKTARKNIRSWTSWGLVVAAISLSPIALIFGIPLAVGAGLDIFHRIGEGPLALALCVPVAFWLLRKVSPRALLRGLAALPVRLHLPHGHAAGPN